MVNVFRSVRRVLRSDGVVFLNLGDSYATTTKGTGGRSSKQLSNVGSWMDGMKSRIPEGLKPKDLLLIPHRVALALQADGWWVRMDNVWSKPNPMPESVQDRPTRSHEYVFMIAKSATYFYDVEAVREPLAEASAGRYAYAFGGTKSQALVDANKGGMGVRTRVIGLRDVPTGRNRRSVWTITPKPYPLAHFATFAPELAEVCIKAGSSEHGCCPVCLAPYRRRVEPSEEYAKLLGKDWADYDADQSEGRGHFTNNGGAMSGQRCVKRVGPKLTADYRTAGWDPTCSCNAGDAIPCTVLDPFAGAGTTLMVAGKLGRDSIGAELNPEYCEMAERRILEEVGPLLVTVEIERPAELAVEQGGVTK